MHQLRSPQPSNAPTPAERALSLALVSETDLLRLKTIARLQARGLPAHVGWDDLLQEAFARVLSGARRRPAEISTVAFLAGVMRSLRAAYWRRSPAGRDGFYVVYAMQVSDDAADGPAERGPQDPAPDPERALGALQEIQAIEALFHDDRVALQIIGGLAEGLSAEQIRARNGLSRIDYDSARRRMRRALLREGLTCGNP